MNIHLHIFPNTLKSYEKPRILFTFKTHYVNHFAYIQICYNSVTQAHFVTVLQLFVAIFILYRFHFDANWLQNDDVSITIWGLDITK